MLTDPWEHRSQRMRCATCMWFVAKAPPPPPQMTPAAAGIVRDAPMPGGIISVAAPKPIIGRCRRHAPTMGGYPVVFDADWCGDHKLDEAKS